MNFKTKSALFSVAFVASVSVASVAQASDGTSKILNVVAAVDTSSKTENAVATSSVQTQRAAFSEPSVGVLYGFGSLGVGAFKDAVKNPKSLAFEAIFSGAKPTHFFTVDVSYSKFIASGATGVRETSFQLGCIRNFKESGKFTMAAGVSAGLARFNSDIGGGNSGSVDGLVGAANMYFGYALPHHLQFVTKLSYGGTNANIGSLDINKAGLFSYSFGLFYKAPPQK